MGRKLRIILVSVGILILVLVIAPFLIPVNQFRPAIEEKASAALGRKVTLGNLSFSLLRGSLSGEDLYVGDDPKFSPSAFLTAKSFMVGVEVMPLIFSKTLHVRAITVRNPQVTLIHNVAGQWNYSSLGGASTKAGQEPTSAETPASSSSLSNSSIGKLELKDGQVSIGSTGSQKRSVYDHVDISASDVSMTSRFPVTVNADLPGGGKFKLDGDVGPIDQTDASLTPTSAKLNVSSLNLASTGLLDPSLGLGGLLDLDATLGSQNGRSETKGTAKLSKALLIAGGSPASEPMVVEFSTSYDLNKNAGVLNPSTLKIGNAIARLSGTYRVAEEIVLNIKVDAQNMPAKDLEAFLPALGIILPKGATIQSGTLNANLNLTGPTNKLSTTGNVGLFDAKVAGFDLGSKMSAIASLAGVQTGKDLQIEKLTTNLQMLPDGLKADHVVAVLPSLGNLVGNGTIDSKNNLDFKMAATLTNALGAIASPISSTVGMIGKFTGADTGCKSGTTVPFLVQGTSSDPKFIPDVGGLAANMVKSQLNCVGSAASRAGEGVDPVKSVSGLTGLFSKK